MKVAFFSNGEYVIDSIYQLYSYISFPDTGIPDSFLREKNLYKVIEYINHDPTYKNLIHLEKPKLIDNLVYTVELTDKNEDQIDDIKWQKVRSIRNSLLQDSDVYIFPDRWEKYNQATKDSWSNYRQSLRDLPITFIKADDVVWPVKPI